jgi:Xaa-Pro aminopeptidase
MVSETEYVQRISRVRLQMSDEKIEVMLVTPGADLSYLTGYHAVPLERITTLVITLDHDPFMIVPRLELSTALASPYGFTDWKVLPWGENDDPFQLIQNRIDPVIGKLAVDNHMWAERVLKIQERFPEADVITAGRILSEIRMRKTPSELDYLREAAAAIDRVHNRIPGILRTGRTEREVGKEIAEMIIEEGHDQVDFVIVASGPNSASPHHELSDRVLEIGDPIVIDIGGTMPTGYCSDCTRTYSLGDPGNEFKDRYKVLQRAQQLSTAAVFEGAISHDIDMAGRNELVSYGLGDYFIHRTGHGIGLETHEDPYIGIDNSTAIESNMVFSIEPGFYIDGVHGARIEDIVICTPTGPESINRQSRDLVIVSG